MQVQLVRLGFLALALLAGPQFAASAQAMDRFDDMTAMIRADPSDAPPAPNFAIEFALDSAQLSPKAAHRLDRIAALLRSNDFAAAELQIAGHSDSSGASDHNRRLSQRRAAAVKAYLVERQGISPSRLETVAWGEERPKHPLDPRDAANRRVEIAVLAPIEPLLEAANQARVGLPSTAGNRREIKIEW